MKRSGTPPAPGRMTARPSPDQVLAAVAAESGFSRVQLCRRETWRGLPAARKLAMLLLHQHARLTWREIGALMDRRLGQSVEKSIERICGQLTADPPLRDLLARIEARLPARPHVAPPPAAKPEDPRKLPKRRKCLMCRGSFASSDAGNRVCNKCKATSVWTSGGDYATYPG